MSRRSVPGPKWDKKRLIARFDVRDDDGNRHRRTLPCESYEGAAEKLTLFRDEFRVATTTPVSTVAMPATLGEYVERYWSTSITVEWAASSLKRSHSAMQRVVLPFFKHERIERIKAPLLADFVAFLRKPDPEKNRKAYQAPTINFALRLVRLILHHAREREVINVVPKFPFCKETPLALELTLDEERAFLAAFDDFESYKAHVQRSGRAHVTDEQAQVYFGWFRASRPVFTVALECGFRVGDLLRLEWSRVDLRQGMVSFIQSKSGKAVSVPMSSACREALQDLKSRPLASHRWVFTQKNGQRYSLTTLRDHFATAKKISGITRRLRLHDLRHSFASKLVSEGISLQIVQGVLGHASVVTTQRYARPDEAARRTVADALDRRRTAASKPNASNGESTAGGGSSKS